jgi:hypothetical protein
MPAAKGSARTPLGPIPNIVATFVSASSQGQYTHSARTNSGHLRLCHQPRAAHAIRSDQNALQGNSNVFTTNKKFILLRMNTQMINSIGLAIPKYSFPIKFMDVKYLEKYETYNFGQP